MVFADITQFGGFSKNWIKLGGGERRGGCVTYLDLSLLFVFFPDMMYIFVRGSVKVDIVLEEIYFFCWGVLQIVEDFVNSRGFCKKS